MKGRIPLLLFLFFPIVSFCQLRLANIFSDNMILQRDEPIVIWGKATPGKEVEILFAGETKHVIVRSDSTWKILLKKQNANSAPQSLKVNCGDDLVLLKNILVGDVWLCSGQSNMEWSMEKEMHWSEEKRTALQPLIRFTNPIPVGRYVYGVAYTDSLNRRLTPDSFYLWNGWKVCDSNTLRSFSAIGYYFARQIASTEKIPIGIINLSIGGAIIETFISRDALEKSSSFLVKVKDDWLNNNSIPEWPRTRAKQNIGNNPNGYRDALGLNHAYKPGFAFEGGVQPILSIPIKGVLWYQGESNAQELPRVEEYKDLFHLLIDDYRKKWKKPMLPFYWVQLSSIDTATYKSQYWPIFRDEQRKLLNEVKYGGMAVCSDIGLKNDVHPTNKKDVGERLARWALNKTYHENIIPSGPLPLSAKYVKGKVIISFQYVAKGLKSSDSKAIRGFSIDGKNDAQAKFGDNGILIFVNAKPEYVYYGWKPFSDGNLVNSENLPASTFKIKVQ